MRQGGGVEVAVKNDVARTENQVGSGAAVGAQAERLGEVCFVLTYDRCGQMREAKPTTRPAQNSNTYLECLSIGNRHASSLDEMVSQ